MSVRDRLLQAKEFGEVLSIRYHGGSKPGSSREIIPIEVRTHKAKCRCYTSNAVKDFMIDKIEILPKPVEAGKDDLWSTTPLPPTFLTVLAVHQAYRTKLENAGWHVEYSEDEDGHVLGLYARLKKGGTRKHPKVTLSFEFFSYDVVMMESGEMQRCNVRERVKPWTVRGPMPTGTWKDASKAIDAFLKAAGISP